MTKQALKPTETNALASVDPAAAAPSTAPLVVDALLNELRAAVEYQGALSHLAEVLTPIIEKYEAWNTRAQEAAVQPEPVALLWIDRFNRLNIAATDPPPAGSFPVYRAQPLTPPAGWVLAAERLPDSGVLVPVLLHGYRRSFGFAADGGWVSACVEHEEFTLGEVTHWMPLPDPLLSALPKSQE